MARRTPPGDYADGSQDQPLFTMPAAPTDRKDDRGKNTKAPTVAWAFCPRCTVNTQADKRVALKAAGVHLQWNAHNRFNVLGASIPCVGSGQLFCAMPPVDGMMRRKRTRQQVLSNEPEIVEWKCRCGRCAKR